MSERDIQDPFLVHQLERARALSDKWIDSQGNLRKAAPLFKDKELRTLFERFKLPVANRYIEKLILLSLDLPLNTPVTLRKLRRAVLSALLTPLRQNVGSCFATAPAILIQQDQPERLLLDLHDLMMTCRLGRTFSGVQNVVPISPSWGIADLKRPIHLSDRKVFQSPGVQAALKAANISTETAQDLVPETDFVTVETLLQRIIYRYHELETKDFRGGFLAKPQEEVAGILSIEQDAQAAFKVRTDHALLKTWEFTLASFSEYKVEFYRWNLYSSLGFDSKEKGGIGELLFNNLQGKLTESNQKTESLHQDYARAIDEVRMTQALLRQASTRDRVRQLKGELDVRLHHAQACKDLRDDSQQRAEHLSNFFKFLLEKYAQHFPEYFQEIFDAEMFDVQTALYDDSPAGFRLMYKHGRRDPSAWTLIHDGASYIQALKSFFTAIEPMIGAEIEWEEGEKELQELTTLLIHHLDTEVFLTSAIERMGKAHHTKQVGHSLENIERFEKKPWSYTSGGTMHTLIRCYYCLDKELTEEKRPVENPMDLLIFLLDLMKSLPYNTTRPFEENSERGMLMYSPTHAFIFRPGLSPFKEGWLDKGFSYTWARDAILTPAETFYEPLRLDAEMEHFLAETLFEKYFPESAPKLLQAFSPHHAPRHLRAFRDHLYNLLAPHTSNLLTLTDRLDGFLHSAFPLLRSPDLERVFQAYEKQPPDFSGFYTASGALKLLTDQLGAPADLQETLQSFGFLPPQPILFADTNWPRYYFGVGYNPGIGGLDLWRFDPTMQEGYPLSIWRPFLDGSQPKPWGVLINPSEYNGSHIQDFSMINKKV